MRKIYIFIVLAGLLSLPGCSDFLNVKPKSIQVVSTVEHYRDVLASYMRLLNTTNPPYGSVLGGYYIYPEFGCGDKFAIFTGESEFNELSSIVYDSRAGEFKVDAVKQMSWLGGTGGSSMWGSYYGFLGAINLVIYGTTTAPETEDERVRDYVQGEALVWRAYAFFKLMQYYCPYMNNDLGLPLHLKPYEDPANAMPARETQTAVYDRIFKDCNQALELLKRTPTNIWNCAYRQDFIYSMLSSVYFYKALSGAAEEKDWENAVKYADLSMRGRMLINTSQAFKDMFDVEAQRRYQGSEFTIRLIDGPNGRLCNLFNTYYSKGTPYELLSPYTSEEITKLFTKDDIRTSVTFRTIGKWTFDKYNIGYADALWGMLGKAGGIFMPFRLADLYLIKAEGLCRMGQEDEARAVLDEFKESRYGLPADSYTESTLLEEILKERKIEFFHEQDMWWIDLKRLRTPMSRVINNMSYELEGDDFRYAFPIPTSEIDVNKNMVQNPGWQGMY